MDVQTIAVTIASGTALGVVIWVLAKIGKALIKIAEALAAAAVAFLMIWLAIKAVLWALRQTVTHWRNPYASALAGCPTRQSSNSKHSSPVPLSTTQQCCLSHANQPIPVQPGEVPHDNHR